ncbi:MAG: WD40 repeat domain-containing protein, partial [Actinomycetota bacterium]
MRAALVLALTSVAVLAGTACGTSYESPSIQVEPSILPTAAEVAVVESALTYTADAALSPSGAARVAPADGQWCLEDASGVRCVDALAEESAAHGIVWRPDETAIAVTWGAQDPISIIDFEAGTSVETDLDNHRILAWSPDGETLVGLDIDEPGQLSRLDPV